MAAYVQQCLMSPIYRVPGVAISILLMVGEKMPDTIDSAFFFGPPQVKDFIFDNYMILIMVHIQPTQSIGRVSVCSLSRIMDCVSVTVQETLAYWYDPQKLALFREYYMSYLKLITGHRSCCDSTHCLCSEIKCILYSSYKLPKKFPNLFPHEEIYF